MGDLISRSALIKAMEKKYEIADKTGLNAVGLDCGFIITERIINEQTTVDAVHVVRCKDCKHRVEPTKMCMHPKAIGWDVIEPEDDDFCSYGEKKEVEE